MPAPVLLIGSVNLDRLLYVDAFPAPGETRAATATAQGLGGKGANQAAQAGMLGASVLMVAGVGDDAEGRWCLEQLERAGVDAAPVPTAQRTGTATVLVAADGENSIVIDPGANAAVTPEAAADAVRLVATRHRDAIVVSQGELTPETIDAIAAASLREGLRFVLNLAPAVPVAAATIAAADPLIVNEREAAAVLGDGELADPLETAHRLAERARSVVITLGARGAVAVVEGRGSEHPAAPPARVLDTTGAGDAFAGAFVAALAAGHPFAEALRWGLAAGAHSVGERGTVTSYADDVVLEALLARF